MPRNTAPPPKPAGSPLAARRADAPLSFIGTQTICSGDNLDQLKRFPAECVDLIYIDPPFNSNRNYEVFWNEKKETRAFEDRECVAKPTDVLNTDEFAPTVSWESRRDGRH
jgi:16S rRNA G966 N2-methylase RsmD